MRPRHTDTPPDAPATVPVAIYTRVSTTSQVGGRFDSCESQAAICRDYLAKHAAEGWQEVASFTDAAYSGSTMNRPGIVMLKRQIEAGAVKVVLIFKLERMLRSTDEWGPFRAFLQQHGCRLVSASEDLSESTPSGRLKNNIMVSVAEYERLNTAEKVRAKMLEQAKRGYWNYGQVPYGYSYDPKAQLLTPDATEAAIVRRIFEDAARLVSLNDLANQLTGEGIRTRTRLWHSREGNDRTIGGTRFRSDKLRGMLRNPLYAGRVRFLGKEYPGKHAALVSDDLWERANAAVNQTGLAPRDHFRAANKWGHLLKGLVLCAHCNRAMVPYATAARGPAQTQYRYYVCGYVRKERDPSKCSLGQVPAVPLESSIITLLGRMANHPDLLQAAVKASLTRKARGQAPLRKTLAGLEAELANTARQINNCVSAIALGGTETLTAEIRQRATELSAQKQALIVQRERTRQELALCDQDAVDERRIRLALARFTEVMAKLSLADQQALMRLSLTRIDVSESPPAKSNGLRQVKLALQLPVARLVEGMEEHIVVDKRATRPLPQRTLALEMTLGMGKGGSAILKPFHHELTGARGSRPEGTPATATHPIRRALKWRKLRQSLPAITGVEFARQQRVSVATVDFHFVLLKLAPEIQSFLAGLTDPRAIRYFGMMRFQPFRKWDHPTQLREFASLRRCFQLEASAVIGSEPKTQLCALPDPSQNLEARIRSLPQP